MGVHCRRGPRRKLRSKMTTGHVDTIISQAARQHLLLQLTTDVGPIRLRKLTDHFGSLDAALSASGSQLQRVAGIGPRIAGSIQRSREDDAVDREIERAASCGLRIVCMEDTGYPQPLRAIPDPPICLYIRGRIEPADYVAVAVVGTRRCSHYSREQALRFGEMLGNAGFTVVSGLARGIDGYAHRGALRGGGRTIAVLGNGLSSIYPPEHQSLADEIAEAGALVSELPVDSQPSAQNFPRRNRIIAGLALGVIIIEAGRKSGALITARLASEYNREVFALPGRVDRPEQTAGVHGLIRDGEAKLITCLEDVLEELGPVGEIMGGDASPSTPADAPRPVSPTAPKLPDHEQAVLDAVVNGVDDADEIETRTGLEIARITAALTSLQLKGLIRRLPGQRFVGRSSHGGADVTR